MSTIDTLLAGFKAFKAQYFEQRPRLFQYLMEAGQQPDVMIIACSDSRVDPAILLNTQPGELFVVRNVGNLVPPYQPDGHYHGTSSALEFAVHALKVKHIVVLGHAHCGGIQAYADRAAPLSPGDFIGKWMTMIAPAAERLGPKHGNGEDEDYIRRLERAAIEQSLHNLMTFPYVADRVASGELALHGAYFGVASGVLLVRDPHDGTFVPAAADASSFPIR
jgi:carbonic anhydrase